jgi:hypothetical protein
MNHLREKLVLASSSPRRTEILERAGWPHEIMVAGIDETVLPNEQPAAYVQRLALGKAGAVANRLREGLVLGADTTVVVGNQILGQPIVSTIEFVVDAKLARARRDPPKAADELLDNEVPLELWSAANAINDKELRKSFLKTALAVLKRKDR